MICPVCKTDILPGHTVIQVPVVCRVERSARDYNRIYFVPLSQEADIIHHSCLPDYVDPVNNHDLIESAKDQVRDEARENAMEDMNEHQAEQYNVTYAEIVDEFESEGWLSQKYFDENR